MTYSIKQKKYVCEGERDRVNIFQPCQGNKNPALLHCDQHTKIFQPPWVQAMAPRPSLLVNVSAAAISGAHMDAGETVQQAALCRVSG